MGGNLRCGQPEVEVLESVGFGGRPLPSFPGIEEVSLLGWAMASIRMNPWAESRVGKW